MTPLIVAGGYLAVALIAARMFMADVYRNQGCLKDGDHFMAGVIGSLWPVVALLGLIWLIGVYVLRPLVEPAAIRRDRRATAFRAAELDARIEAEKHGLPYPSPTQPDGKTS